MAFDGLRDSDTTDLNKGETPVNSADATLRLLQALQVYFQGEKTEALVFILPIGALSAVFGLWLWTDSHGGFMRGVAIPFVVMGLVMSTVGAVVGFRTPSQIEAIEHSLRVDSKAGLLAEGSRMAKVDRAWKFYLAIWGLFGVIGLVLRFATTSDFYQGLGIALVFFGGIGLLVDGFAERRTHPYIAALQAADAGQSNPHP